MKIPVYYDVLEENIQLPSGLPGLVGQFNEFDLSLLLDEPNSDLVRAGLAAVSGAGDVRGRGTVTPNDTGNSYDVLWFVMGAEAEEDMRITIPITSIPSPTSIVKLGVNPIIPVGDSGSDFAATFSIEQVDADGNVDDTDSPSFVYDAANMTSADPSSPSVWGDMQILPGTVALNLVLSSVTPGTGIIDGLSPLFVVATVGTSLWLT